MSRRDGSCWRHPAQRAAGVCADCLKERLHALSPPPEPRTTNPPSIPRSSALGFLVVDPNKKRLASEHQRLHPFPSSDAHLRRSKSWSHWEAGAGAGASGASNHAWAQQSNGFALGGGGRKSDAVLDDWTRQRFFSIFAKGDQSHHQHNQKRKDSSNQLRGGGNSEFRKSASGGDRVERAWQPHVEPRGFVNPGRVTILEHDNDDDERSGVQVSSSGAGNHGAGKSSTCSRKSSTWWASLLHFAMFRKPKHGEKKKQGSSRGTRTGSLTGYFNKSTRKEGEKKQAPPPPASSWKHNHKHIIDGTGNGNWISSPLRIFKSSTTTTTTGSQNHNHKRNKEVVSEQNHQGIQEERSSWSIPSSNEFRRLHPASGYTAYYRDYGTWSLSSSPVPNNRWSNGGAGGGVGAGGNRGKQPWESRDHSSSSPYHHHSSTWNFYLTPLRPVKATGGSSSSGASKHRK